MVTSSIDYIQPVNISQRTKEFIQNIVTHTSKWGEHIVAHFQVGELSEQLNKSERSIMRYIHEAETAGVLSTYNKRGRNGGTLVEFNLNCVSVQAPDNPFTKENPDIVDIREKLFPSKKKPKRTYRDKKVIAEEKARSQRKKDNIFQLNNQLDKMGYLKPEFFKQFPEPKLYLDAWLVSRMYNAFSVLYYKRIADAYEEDGKQSQGYKKYYNYAKQHQGTDCLPRRFVGTWQYTCFLRLTKYLQEHNINPLSYLTVQFKRIEYLGETKQVRPGSSPYVNTLLSESAINQYEKEKNFILVKRNTTNLYSNSLEEVPYACGEFPIIVALSTAYKYGERSLDQLDRFLQDLEGISLFSQKANRLFTYYLDTLGAIEKQKDFKGELTDKEEDAVKTFLKNQVANFSNRHSVTPAQFIIGNSIQIKQHITIEKFNKVKRSASNIILGNIRKQPCGTDEEVAQFKKLGERIYTSFEGSITFPEVVQFLGEYSGLSPDFPTLQSALAKIPENLIPLDSRGFLDAPVIWGEDTIKEDLEYNDIYEEIML